MELKFRCRCHFCRAALDPHIVVRYWAEYLLVVKWINFTKVNVTSNDAWLRILAPNKTVRCCRDCYSRPKISLRDIIRRETRGVSSFKSPPRKTWNDQEIIQWYSAMQNWSYEDVPDELFDGSAFRTSFMVTAAMT
jgi:hypothetical protein